MNFLRVVCVFVWLSVVPVAGAESPQGWRRNGSGVYPNTDPPIKWSVDSNVLWKAPMPGRSNALPVLTGDRIFVCSEPFSLICLDAGDGRERWRRENDFKTLTDPSRWKVIAAELAKAEVIWKQVAEYEKEVERLQKVLEEQDDPRAEAQLEKLQDQIDRENEKLTEFPLAVRYRLPITQPQYNGYTTATPVTDGKHIWAVFGNRAVVCYDLDGVRVWSQVLPDLPQAMWGHSSSPLLVEGKLIINIDATTALDSATGEIVWRAKYGQSWGSGVQTRLGEEAAVLLANGRWLRARDGRIMARVPPLADASPVVVGDTAYYIGINATAYAVPDRALDRLELEERWTAKPKGSRFYASPVVYDGLIYTVSTQHVLTVLDARTGVQVYARRLKLGSEPVWASLCVAGNCVYVSSRDGVTVVLAAGRKYRELARNDLEYFIATPVFTGNRMYVRTSNYLYCIGGGAESR